MAQVHESASGLKRSLGLIDLVAYGLAYLSLIAALTTFGFVWDASGGLITLAYILGAVCIYFTAKSYAMMAGEQPQAGSVYAYAKMALGPFVGFLAGWLILLDYLLIPALVFILMSIGMQTLMPSISRAAWILLLVAFAFFVNWRGVKVSTKVSLTSVAVQFVIIVGVLVFAYIALHHGKGTGGLSLAPIYQADTFDLKKVFAATSICIIAFLGFDAITTLSEEVKGDSRKLVGQAIMLVLLISAMIFIVSTWFVGNLAAGLHIHDPAAAIYEILTQQIGTWAALVFAWLTTIFVSFTNALPMQVGVARVLFAMGRNQQLPEALAKIHPRTQIPHVAMIVSTLISLTVALVMKDHVDTLALFVNFGALAGFLLLHVSVLVHLGLRNPQRRFLPHVCVPVLGIVIVLAVFANMQHDALILGVIWTGLGVAYGLYLQHKGRVELALDLKSEC